MKDKKTKLPEGMEYQENFTELAKDHEELIKIIWDIHELTFEKPSSDQYRKLYDFIQGLKTFLIT